MKCKRKTKTAISWLFVALLLVGVQVASGQSTSGSVRGTVKDATGASIPGATVTLGNGVSGYSRTATTDETGEFGFSNLPFNPYRVTATAKGFAAANKLVQVSSSLPNIVALALPIASTATEIEVEAPADLVENDPNDHTDIDRSTIDRLPVESPSSQLSSIVTQLSPGVAADSNGLLHGLGDHNEVSFSVDGQPITDQQSKVFSNQLPADAVQSLEVIEGAPPAEYGDKTSLIIVATTRSGLGTTKPTGEVAFSYGTFGTGNVLANLAWGGQNWGNFISVSGLDTGRFLDAPEFLVYHDRGNEVNLFDRIDFQLSHKSSLHLNLQYTRSWFQTPNTWDQEFGYVQAGLTPGRTDQRSKIGTFMIAPTYTRVISDKAVFNFAPYIRRDDYDYVPSNNAFADFGPIQQESVAQQRSLTNAGVHSDLTFTNAHQTFKLGGVYQQTFLRENLQTGLVDPGLNDPADPAFNPVLAPYDLTRGGVPYFWHGQTDVKQLALYGQDQIRAGNWLFNLGIRGDFYNGLARQRQAEPRAGISYSIPRTGTVLRVSYARTQETPFNENLVLAANGCLDPVLNGIFSTLGPCDPAPFNPGFRNEFHAGFQQSIGRHFVLDAEYITKYTHNAYDFSVFGATPITFPIEWKNSKIPGYTVSGTLTNVKGLTGRFTFSSVAARFFNPQIGGVGTTIGSEGGFPFRIDHDERFNANAHVSYALPFRKSLYYSVNLRYDSGLVAGPVPCYNVSDPNSGCGDFSFDGNGNPLTVNGQPAVDLSSLTADQQFQAGLTCDGVRATQNSGFSVCDAAGFTSKLVSIPVPGTENDDHNPPRVSPRTLFDMELGDENLLHFGQNERYRIGARVTAINVTNSYSLYNFLSTFSGTHYVTPRTVSGEIAFRF